MNTPVNYKLAKLLKEKEFNKKCTSFYDLISNTQIDNAPLGNYNLTKQSVSIPTIVEVVMWLYEKHGIWIEVRFFQAFKLFYFELSNVNNLKGMTSKGENHFNSPTEAYLAAIEYTLTKLI